MGGVDFTRVRAIFRRDLANYLGNPTGYVFITLFIMTTAAGAFLQEGFFQRNLADLAQLNAVMPAILMLFVPAITMAGWSGRVAAWAPGYTVPPRVGRRRT